MTEGIVIENINKKNLLADAHMDMSLEKGNSQVLVPPEDKTVVQHNTILNLHSVELHASQSHIVKSVPQATLKSRDFASGEKCLMIDEGDRKEKNHGASASSRKRSVSLLTQSHEYDKKEGVSHSQVIGENLIIPNKPPYDAELSQSQGTIAPLKIKLPSAKLKQRRLNIPSFSISDPVLRQSFSWNRPSTLESAVYKAPFKKGKTFFFLPKSFFLFVYCETILHSDLL